MLEPLTVWRGEVPWLVEHSVLKGGTMLTSVPVSTRNRIESMWSFIYNRRPLGGLAGDTCLLVTGLQV